MGALRWVWEVGTLGDPTAAMREVRGCRRRGTPAARLSVLAADSPSGQLLAGRLRPELGAPESVGSTLESRIVPLCTGFPPLLCVGALARELADCEASLEERLRSVLALSRGAWEQLRRELVHGRIATIVQVPRPQPLSDATQRPTRPLRS